MNASECPIPFLGLHSQKNLHWRLQIGSVCPLTNWHAFSCSPNRNRRWMDARSTSVRRSFITTLPWRLHPATLIQFVERKHDHPNEKIVG